MSIFDTDEEIEAFRLERLEALAEDREMAAAELVAESQAGSLRFHEALHTASLVLDFNDRHLADHPAVVANPAVYQLAHKAHEYLFALYQRLGEIDFDHDRPVDEGIRPDQLTSENDG